MIRYLCVKVGIFVDDSCANEALAAAAWNIPMIAFVSKMLYMFKNYFEVLNILLCVNDLKSFTEIREDLNI